MELDQVTQDISSLIKSREQEILAVAQQNTKEIVEKEMALLDFELLLSANTSEEESSKLTKESRALREEAWSELNERFDGDNNKINEFLDGF
tara:strand:+ start:597 stop:872 length:276 start_codon:yes stop_codon:yes gene_type:complete